MVTFRDLMTGLRRLEIDRKTPVIVHASLSSFGEVAGGADTIVGALTAVFDTVIMPTFTYKTMVTPESGPENNGVTYGSGKDTNRMSEFFSAHMPADRLMGTVSETMRRNPRAQRSSHPILSFCGVNAQWALEAQTLDKPLAPIGALAENQGWVLLLGVNHTVNTSIHYAEWQLKRKQFVRWALTPKGVIECPGFPGCSEGFQSLETSLSEDTRHVKVGLADIKAVSLESIVRAVGEALADDAMALLCSSPECERCNALRYEMYQAAQQ